MKKKAFGVSAAIAGIGLALAMTAVPASADPVGNPTFRPLAGMGSDTTQGVMNGLSDVVLDGGQKAIASYDVSPFGQKVSTKDTTFANANCNVAGGGGTGGVVRANGSGAGIAALTASMTLNSTTEGCLDFARSSSTTPGANQTFIPMAQDGLVFAIPFNGKLGSQATLADLQGIYTCATPGFVPLIPQSSSGTRKAWASLMGIDSATLNACVKDSLGGVLIEEHDGTRFTAANQVVPFSVAQYVAQMFGTLPDKRGTAQLGQLNGVNPLIQNPAQTTLRTVGNILPTTTFSNTASLGYKIFVNDGSGKSAICVQGKSTIEKYGFIASTC